MKLLHIIASVDPAGGGPIESLRQQDQICRQLGVDVHRELATLDPPDSPYLAEMGMQVHALGRRRRGGGLIRRAVEHYGYSPDFVPWLKENLHRYDAAVVHGLWNYASFGASRVLPQGPLPYFVFPHGMMDPWFRRTYPLKDFAKRGFWLLGEGRLLAGAKSVMFTSREEREAARGEFPFWHYREAVVGYGTSEPPAETPDQHKAFAAAVSGLAGRPYLLFLSRIHRKKGCDLLIEAFAQAVAVAPPDLQLVIAGPDEEGMVTTLQARAQELGVGTRIHWPGMLRGDAKWGAFRGAEAFILPSHQENFGIVVAEALACGTPVLITNKVNIWREVDDAGAGLVRSDDLEGSVALLRDWFTLDEDVRRRARAEAIRLFNDSFNLNLSASRIVDYIKDNL